MPGMSNKSVTVGAGVGVVIAAVIAWFFLSPAPQEPQSAGAPTAQAPTAEPAAAPSGAAQPAAEVAAEAASQEVAAPSPEVAPEVAPEMIPEIAAPILPKMDVVRVAPDGSATVAGTAEAGARVSLRVDDAEAAFATADASGAYASLFTLPPFDAPRVLTVAALGASGVLVQGTDSFVIAPIAAPQLAEAAPALQAPETLKLDDSGVQVLSSADIANVTVESISYDGEIIRVGGRGAAGSIVRLYVDNADTASANITADGRFSANLAGVAPGTYTLRADQLDGAGAVTSRYEMTITKSAPEALAAAAAVPTVIEVAQGTTLWAIAQANFGDGLLYIQVYEANKDKIRDPDLIYPGQVFTIPALQ